MLVVVIKETTLARALHQIQASALLADAIELRLDYFLPLNIQDVQQLIESSTLPVIFSLRHQDQGGKFTEQQTTQLYLIEKLAQLKPQFIDLEEEIPIEFAKKLKKKWPQLQLIRSYHNLIETPLHLNNVLERLKNEVFSYYTLETYAQSTLDCLHMFHFIQQQPSSVTGICRGELGLASQILSVIMGNALHYASFEEESDLIGLSALLTVYRFRALSKNTSIYALLGDPIDKSAGHIVHNYVFEKLGVPAIYVKLLLNEAELKTFFQLILSLPFKGFSITMPLKEAVIPYLHHIEENAAFIKSVNTIVTKKEGLLGINTDAKGALDAIENKQLVAGKTIMIIGAGATARALALEAINRQASVIIINRTADKAYFLANQLKCRGLGIDELAEIEPLHYNILINTTPLGMSGQAAALPISEHYILANCIVMDCVYNPVVTPLLNAAKNQQCTLVYGYEMFINQAARQCEFWLAIENKHQEIQQLYFDAFRKKVLT